jgi:hypothetical protein
MNVVDTLKKLEKLAIDNSPFILTAIAVTGVLTTSFLTGKATFEAADIIREEEAIAGTAEDGWPVVKERTVMVWKLYIPAVTTGVLTIVCIVVANRIGTRRAAAIAAAYSISEKAFSEYKDKVVEKVGVGQEQRIRDEIAQDRIGREPLGEREIIITGNGEVLCFDAFSGRYFESDMETLKKAMNDVNYMIISEGYASLGDFYGKIGLSETQISDELGWTSDLKLDIKFSGTLSDDQRPCISMEFRKAPIRGYYRQH